MRRALLRAKIDRIGLGGYLHLVENYPDFCDYIEKVSDEFRLIRSFHNAGKPYAIRTKAAVLHSWGALRSWTLSGHFHETYMHDLIHINEALSGLPVDVKFISFEDVKKGALEDINVVINAGRAGSAWSGGENWKDDEVVTILTKWVHEGGTFIGVNEPSAVEGYDTYFRMAHVLGIDEDTGARVCHGKWQFTPEDKEGILPAGASVGAKEHLYLTDGKARVLLAAGAGEIGKVAGSDTVRSGSSGNDTVLDDSSGNGAAQDSSSGNGSSGGGTGELLPLVCVNEFGKGKGIYLASFRVTTENTRMLYQLIRYAGGEGMSGLYMTDNLYTECAYYPESRKLVIINNSDREQTTGIPTKAGDRTLTMAPYDTVFMELDI